MDPDIPSWEMAQHDELYVSEDILAQDTMIAPEQEAHVPVPAIAKPRIMPTKSGPSRGPQKMPVPSLPKGAYPSGARIVPRMIPKPSPSPRKVSDTRVQQAPKGLVPGMPTVLSFPSSSERLPGPSGDIAVGDLSADIKALSDMIAASSLKQEEQLKAISDSLDTMNNILLSLRSATRGAPPVAEANGKGKHREE